MAQTNSDGSIVLSTKIVFDGVDKAINNIKSKFSSLKQEKATISTLTQAIKDQQFVLNNLNKEYANFIAQGKGESKQAQDLKTNISNLTNELNEMKSAASVLGVKSTKSFDGMAEGLKKVGKRLGSIVKSALVFSVIYKVMQSVVKLFKNILMSDKQFRQDWEELKSAFYTATYPIINLLVPALKWIIVQTKEWAISIGKVVAAIKGISYSQLADEAKASKEMADNYENMAENSKKMADNAKRQSASFDEIQVLSSGDQEQQSLGGFETIKEYDTSGEKSMLDDLMTAIGGALAALGVILLFKGHIGWGVGFIVAGAAFWAIGEIWGEDYDPNSTAQILNNVMQTIGVSLSAIGIILLTKGVLTWGLAFLVAGAAFWGISQFAEGEFDTDPIVNTLIKIMGIAGTALLAIGIILCVFGQITPISIGMILAGAGLLVSAVTLNNEAVLEAIRGPIGIITAIVSGALLVLGIILVVNGIFPLGIGLIMAGAIGLATVVAVNWNAIVEALRGPIGTITAIVSGALLVLGIILVCTLVAIPLGIGLIAAGAVGLVTVVAVNWSGIVDKIKTTINKIIDWVKTYGLLVLGVMMVLTGVGIPLGIALIIKWAKDGAEKGVPIATKIVEKVKEIFNQVVEWVQTYGMLVLGILLCLTGISIPIGIAIIIKWVKEGAEEGVPLATAIVDKVKEIWGKIKAFWDSNIAPLFTASFWLDLAKTCGNALIDGFEGAVNGIISIFENMINWIIEALNKISIEIPDWVPGVGGGTFGFNLEKVSFSKLSIPRLASGAVIPANKEFLAVLGDQKQGMNIETPLATMVEAFQMALDSRTANGGGSIEVILELDGREFGRAVVEQGNIENRRIGTKLVIAQ